MALRVNTSITQAGCLVNQITLTQGAPTKREGGTETPDLPIILTFHNEENGRAVLRVEAQGHPDLVTLVGCVWNPTSPANCSELGLGSLLGEWRGGSCGDGLLEVGK